MSSLPGGAITSRPLHFIWIVDCSGSMSGEKIESLNIAVKNAIPAMQLVSDSNPNAQVLVRALKFSTGAQWHVTTPTPIQDFKWQDLTANGVTDMGKAMLLVAEQLKMPPMSEKALPPVLVLLSDGQPTDDFNAGLKALMDLPWGKKSVRISIAIGGDADMDVLQKFIGNNEQQPLLARNADQLVTYIKWVSTAVLKAVSQPTSQIYGQGQPTGNVVIPAIPTTNPNAPDVW